MDIGQLAFGDSVSPLTIALVYIVLLQARVILALIQKNKPQ